MSLKDLKRNPRVIIIQKLYSNLLNPDNEFEFPKHRFKKFIKDVVLGTIERKELIDENINNFLNNDIEKKKTDKLIIILLQAAVFEFLYKPQTSINIVINEYLNAATAFIDEKQKNFLNALLDKISKKIRKYD
jgi:N utilization substance protein B|tara:strand:- start:2410 stop:2808 length:399 start_codon:yes stop_codon:yes gene_type:complete